MFVAIVKECDDDLDGDWTHAVVKNGFVDSNVHAQHVNGLLSNLLRDACLTCGQHTEGGAGKRCLATRGGANGTDGLERQ